MKIQVHFKSCSELHDTLNDMPARKRAERIRLLATLGLMAERGIFQDAVKPAPSNDLKKIRQLKGKNKFR